VTANTGTVQASSNVTNVAVTCRTMSYAVRPGVNMDQTARCSWMSIHGTGFSCTIDPSHSLSVCPSQPVPSGTPYSVSFDADPGCQCAVNGGPPQTAGVVDTGVVRDRPILENFACSEVPIP
jgi:hypothetical protein